MDADLRIDATQLGEVQLELVMDESSTQAETLDELKRIQGQIFAKKQRRLISLENELQCVKLDLVKRTKNMIRDLLEVYPIKEFPDRRGFSICDIHLPKSENLDGHDATMISVAIGYVGHLLLLLSEILDITLRFPLKFHGSRSSIYCSRKDQYFPLFIDSTKSKVNFLYGISLLNLDIVQIRILQGIQTDDPEQTLANLHELMNVLIM